MTKEIEQRAHLIRVAVGFALMPPDEPELRLLHRSHALRRVWGEHRP